MFKNQVRQRGDSPDQLIFKPIPSPFLPQIELFEEIEAASSLGPFPIEKEVKVP